jgi:hypothetical protein
VRKEKETLASFSATHETVKVMPTEYDKYLNWKSYQILGLGTMTNFRHPLEILGYISEDEGNKSTSCTPNRL